MKLEDLKNKEFEITSDGLLKVVEKKTGRFIPKKGEKYWFINSKGCIDWIKYDNDDIDRWVINHTPVFATCEEVEEYEHYLEVLDKCKYEFSEEEWGNESIKKWHLCCHTESGELSGYCAFTTKSPNCVYFKSQEDAELFIEEVGEENVKRFMFDVWENV